jgi:hypothetical protein
MDNGTQQGRSQLVRLFFSVACVVVMLVSPASPVGADSNVFTGSASTPDAMQFQRSSLRLGRSSHTATLLGNGKVLVVGGYDEFSTPTATAELYDPVAGTWSFTGSMATARAQHAATLLGSGLVLVTGGEGGDPSDPTLLSSAELYDPLTGTWSSVASMAEARKLHTATLLGNGKVLVAGGHSNGSATSVSELFDPASGLWSGTGGLNTARWGHAAVRLNDGRVLAMGGYGGSVLTSAEIYNPLSGTWNITDAMDSARYLHTATLLGDGRVLAAGGSNGPGLTASTELFDPLTGMWSPTGDMGLARVRHTATLLGNSLVLVEGGYSGLAGYTASAEFYDPAAGTWRDAGTLLCSRASHTATLLANGKVLAAGGDNDDPMPSTSTNCSELGTLNSGNTFNGSLSLPSGWLNSTTLDVLFSGTTSGAALNAGALSNDGLTWGGWIIASPGTPVTASWDVGGEGAARPVHLRLRDTNGVSVEVVTGSVDIDLTGPASSITSLPATSPANIPLTWSGTDALSGISTYDVQVREGSAGNWTDVVTNTASTSTTYPGTNGHVYFFRTRAKDAAGNLEDWPADFDTYTVVDTDAPTGTVVINNGALSTTVWGVRLSLDAHDVMGSVTQVSLSNDGTTWNAWQPYAYFTEWALSDGDGLKTIFARFMDQAGNVSAPVASSITLNTHIGMEYGLSINFGGLFTNSVGVTLTIPARPYTQQMMISNDGGFVGAVWEPYASPKAWQITQYASYVIPRIVYVRFRDGDGAVTAAYQDDIILDVTPPTGTVAIGSGSGPDVVLTLLANDDVSGMDSMLISNRSDFAGAVQESYTATRAWTLDSNMTVYVRYRDKAGNTSATLFDSRRTIYRLYIPFARR